MDWMGLLKMLADIFIVAYIIYKMLIVLQGTRAIQILKGLSLIMVIWVLSGILGLETVKFIFSQILIYGLLGIIIIFQPELRKALERLGSKKLWWRGEGLDDKLSESKIEAIVDAMEYMSKRRIGALISIEMGDSLQEYVQTGIKLHAHLSKELLINIFTPNVPLHDGAVIIRNNRVEAASCYLPLSDNMYIPKELGTRHRAAIGLSEVTDAIVLVVSEETGNMSVVRYGKIYRGLTKEEIVKHLMKYSKKEG